MISPDALFQACGALAATGWLTLLLAPAWPARLRDRIPRRIAGITIPATLAAVYTAVLVTHWSGHAGNFNSLDGVVLLFTNRALVLAGWIHYLAFDLFLGGWELADSRARAIPHAFLVPVLLLTFFFGPVGFLLYLAVRTVARRTPRSPTPG